MEGYPGKKRFWNGTEKVAWKKSLVSNGLKDARNRKSGR